MRAPLEITNDPENVDLLWSDSPDTLGSRLVATNENFVALWSHHHHLFIVKALRVMMLDQFEQRLYMLPADQDWNLAVHLETNGERVFVKRCTIVGPPPNLVEKYQGLVIKDNVRPRHKLQIGNVSIDVRPGRTDALFSQNDVGFFCYVDGVDAWAQVKDFNRPLTRSRRRILYHTDAGHMFRLRV